MNASIEIDRARVRVLRAPVDDGIAMSFAPLRHRTMILVELYTPDGAVGYGESWANFPAWAPDERVATLCDGVLPLVLGETRDGHARERLVGALSPIARQWGAPGPIMQAISAVDIALWDLRGRLAGTSISRLLGAPARDRVSVYGSGVGPTNVQQQASKCLRDGHTAIKVKIGFGHDRDVEILAHARQQLGADFALYADANQAWTLAEAIAMQPMLDEFGVRWIEEPISGNRLEDLEEFHRTTDFPVATGENIYGQRDFKSFIDSPAVAVIQPDVAKAGGITELIAICQYAETKGKVVMPHLYGGAIAYAASLQVAAAAGVVRAVEYDIRSNPLRDPLMTNPPKPVGGEVVVPDGDGLGVSLDPEAVLSYEVKEYERECCR